MSRVRGNGAGAASAASAVVLATLLLGALVAGTAAAATAGAAAADRSPAPPTAGAADAERGPASAIGAASETVAVQGLAAAEGAALAQEIDPDRTRIRVALQPDGDGRWTVELWTRLADDADEEAFSSLQADVRNNSEAFTADFRDRMNGSVVAASDATGREMAIENVTVSTRTEGVPSSYGVLVYEFEWTSFAAVDGDRLVAGDAIDGFLLVENTRLTISWPETYRLADVEPTPDDETDAAVVWQGGETDFVAGQPRVVVTSSPAEDDSLLPMAAVVVALLAVLLVVAWLVRSGRLDLPVALGGPAEPADGGERVAGTGSGGAPDGTGGAAAVERDDDHGGAVEPEAPTDEAGAGADGDRGSDANGDDGSQDDAGDGADDASDGATDAEGQDDTDDVPPELRSNEEQVLRLLEDHGGRMKQQQVVSELDWTEAKTSQVVTGMREEAQIEVFRIGRENVLALPEEADL